MIGRLIDGRYQVRSRIARGGMATVYLATDLRLERRVAIKIMHGHLSDDSKFKERFIQEARSAARLAHPNVVNVFDQGQDSDMAYLVMEYLPGITLRDLLQEHGRLTTDQTLDILEAVLSGLSAAHKAGIVHRDLKPENVLLADDGRIKIGDFGLARAASANTATGAALLGTIAYLSPELVTRGVADTRSDIYAVGIMTYEMLTGEQPFKGEQPMQIAYQHANDSVPTPSDKNSRIPVELDELVLWATAREPDERPRDAKAMLDEVMSTQTALQSAEPQTAALPTQRTRVLQSLQQTRVMPRGTTGETQVLTPLARRQAPPMADSVEALSVRAKRRRGRGWWLFAAVLVIAALVGGTAWYYGTGPGARVAIPSDIRGLSLTAAQDELRSQGFRVDPTEAHTTDPTIPKGNALGTKPAAGTAVAKGSTVQLVRSDGPKLLALPGVIGQPEDLAKAKIVAAGFVAAANPIKQFDAKVSAGLVLDDLDANGTSLAGHTLYAEKRSIRLVISAGALPTVAGLSQSDAENKLLDAGLTATPGSHVYSLTVPENSVVGIDMQPNSAGKSRTFRVGDKDVQLLISRGPQLVEVPNVIGDTWDVAKRLLTAAGFKLSYDPAADIVPGLVTVKHVSPAGSPQPKGSTLKIRFTN
jgi:serine/threonine protein kinase/beta-lactam-binding protein with PASTA domain